MPPDSPSFTVDHGLKPVAPAPAASGARLHRRERLRGRDRLDAIFAIGSVGQTRLVTAKALPTPYPLTRVAFVVGRAAGKANVRVRLKRRLRALYRESKQEKKEASPENRPQGWDIVVMPRRGALEAAPAALAHDLGQAIRKAITPRSPQGNP